MVRCGPAEIDGYAFFSGLSALKLPWEHYPRLQPLVSSVAYLAMGAAFRSRCTTSQAGRFSLDICHLGQLVDMYHNHQATDDRDRIYALLGMSSDDPGTLGLLVDYEISWTKLFKQLVHSILGSVTVNTWDEKAVAVIRSKGCVLGRVFTVDTDKDRNNKQRLSVTWNGSNHYGHNRSNCQLETSAEPVEEDDVVCLLQGATLPTIIRMHNDYWYIIVVAAALNHGFPEITPMPTIFPHDFLLVWDWDLCLDKFEIENEYEDLMGHLASQATQPGLQTDCEKITRLWNSGVAMRSAVQWEEENLRKAVEVLEHILRNLDSIALTGLGRDHRMTGDDMKQLQGIIDLISKDKDGSTSLSLAAEAGCEAVARLLLDTGKADPNAQDEHDETPLLRAAKKGHESIVKLLLSIGEINPNARGKEDGPTPLVEAARNGHEAIVKLLINNEKVDVNAVGSRMTPLMLAALRGHTAIVELLLSTSGVEPDFGFKPEGTLYTALSLAVEHGQEEVVKLLLGVTQVPLDLVFGEDYAGDYMPSYTLLSTAEARKDEGIIKLLQRAMELETVRMNKGKES